MSPARNSAFPCLPRGVVHVGMAPSYRYTDIRSDKIFIASIVKILDLLSQSPSSLGHVFVRKCCQVLDSLQPGRRLMDLDISGNGATVEEPLDGN